MTIRERLQAFLDGRILCAKGRWPHRLREDRIEFLTPSYGWSGTSTIGSILDPEVEVAIYEEPKPEPTAREKREKFCRKFDDTTNSLQQADAIADYIDARLKELGK